MAVKLDNASTTGRPTFTQVNNANEQTVFTSTETRPRIFSCYLDLQNLANNSTIRFNVRVDGTNFRVFPLVDNGTIAHTFTQATDVKGVQIGPVWVADQVRVTVQAAIAEGPAIPYHVVEEFCN